MKRTSITVKLDEHIKKEFNNLCEEIGLNMNSVLNALILKTIRENGISLYMNDVYESEETIKERIKQYNNGTAMKVYQDLREV